MMIMIDMFPSRISCHQEYHQKLQLPWTLKSWPCRSRCSKKCLRNIRNRKKRNNRKSISKRLAERRNNILNLRPLVKAKDLLGSCKRTQKDNLKAGSDLWKMISSPLLIKVELLLISILTSAVELPQLNRKRQTLVLLRLKKQRQQLTLMISWICSPLMHLPLLFSPNNKNPLPRLTISSVALILPLCIFQDSKLNNKIRLQH